jgi:hypothetical protein
MGHLDRYYEAVEGIRAAGRSPDRAVTVAREPNGEIYVRIRPGTLRLLSDEEVAAEIRAALLAAPADHRGQFVEVRTRFFGSALFATDLTPPEPLSTRSGEW